MGSELKENNSVKRFQAYRYELRPNGDQLRKMRRIAGCCRFVYNKGLDLQKSLYAAGEKKASYAGLCKTLTGWRRDPSLAWLADAPIHPLQQSLKDLERAYSNFFAKRASFPRFAKKGRGDSFRYPDAKQFKVDAANGRVFLPKLGWIRYRNSRLPIGQPKSITVSRAGEKWFVSIQTERDVEQPIHPATSSVGIDLGIARFATLSTGDFILPLHSLKQCLPKLARVQRSMARKVKFSKNWNKARQLVAKIHAHIAAARGDFLHKNSTSISKNHAMVFIEDLRVRNMSASATGTKEVPGRNVRAKSGLNRAILDQGWYEFRRQLEYKIGWMGGELMAIPPQYTSQTCPACGHISSDNRRSQALFTCMQCGHEGNADHVGALNILRAGHARLACGEVALPGPSVKQEPAEAIECGGLPLGAVGGHQKSMMDANPTTEEPTHG